MFDESIDPEILFEFIDESIDSLAALPEMFIQLENFPYDLEIVNAIFRPVHSIKGNSAFFGMLKLKQLTHEMETTLDLCRKHELVANKDIIDTLLSGLDAISDIFQNAREQKPEVEDDDAFQALILEIVLSQKIEEPPAADQVRELLWKIRDTDCLEGTPEEDWLLEALNKVEKLCVTTDKSSEIDESENLSVIDSLIKMVSTPVDDCYSDEESERFGEKLKKLKEQVDASSESFYDKVVDDFETFSMTVGFDNLLADIMKEKLVKLKEMQPDGFGVLEEEVLTVEKDPDVEKDIDVEKDPDVEKDSDVEKGPVEESRDESGENDSDDSAEPVEKENSVVMSSKSMRVPEDTIDEFLNFVGELIVAREMYDHLRQHFEEEGVAPELTTELRRYTDNFRQVSAELERTCMNIRKQPIKGILQKMPRIVRDVASALGKKIEVKVTGDNISVDKSLIGTLEAPLVHMIRNSADHGIEVPAIRLSADKDETGIINVDVTEDDEFLYISIKDDGHGLNFEALKDKGVEMGLFDEHSHPSEEEIAQVIFKSGISTAEAVTDISGRGVGMDVVKRYIEGAGGSVHVQSETGKGSEFTITMRKSITTQIIDGLILRLEDTCYVIPLKYVVESFPPTEDSFCTVTGVYEHIKRHDAILPVIRLEEVFSSSMGERKKNEGILVVINYNGKKGALMVDEVVNIQQVVLKPLKGLHLHKNLFTGGALRGDGYISLILDIEHILSDTLVIC
jgi:two-component system, chemotaxis family, sensor kinase CheA